MFTYTLIIKYALQSGDPSKIIQMYRSFTSLFREVRTVRLTIALRFE